MKSKVEMGAWIPLIWKKTHNLYFYVIRRVELSHLKYLTSATNLSWMDGWMASKKNKHGIIEWMFVANWKVGDWWSFSKQCFKILKPVRLELNLDNQTSQIITAEIKFVKGFACFKWWSVGSYNNDVTYKPRNIETSLKVSKLTTIIVMWCDCLFVWIVWWMN